MRLMLKLGVLLLMLALFIPMWLKDPSGKPIMQAGDWLEVPAGVTRIIAGAKEQLDAMGGAENAQEPALAPATVAPAAASGEFYRWQDARGKWHFSDQPPPDGQDAVAETLPQMTNSMQALAPPTTESSGAPLPMDSSITPPVGLPEGVSREAMEKMLQEAHQRRMGEHL